LPAAPIIASWPHDQRGRVGNRPAPSHARFAARQGRRVKFDHFLAGFGLLGGRHGHEKRWRGHSKDQRGGKPRDGMYRFHIILLFFFPIDFWKEASTLGWDIFLSKTKYFRGNQNYLRPSDRRQAVALEHGGPPG